MALTAAERQKRRRAHLKGDHALCDPDRRDCVTPVTAGVTQPTTPSPELGTRGRRLWHATLTAGTLNPAQLVLLEEACRLADRLDRLDAILRGDEDAWMRFRVDDTEVTVTLDKTLSEARAQAVALKQIVSELRQSAGKAEPEREASGSDELARRREERRAAAGL